MLHTSNERRYDIDWLRTLAFGVLILYHIGMYYVTDWGWHIKSAETSTLLQELMILTNPWRMSLLFLLSGIALAMVLKKYGTWQLIRLRTMRLLVPLLFGMFVICVPQVYFEALSQDLIKPGFFSFWRDYINPNTELLREHHTVIGLLTWNHLWFLPYVWLYSILFIAFHKPLAKAASSSMLKRVPTSLAIFFVVTALMVVWLTLRKQFPPTNALVNDWYNHGKYLLSFSFGYFLVHQQQWWQQLILRRNLLLLVGVCGWMFIVADRHDMFQPLADQFESSLIVRTFYGVILSANHWAWIFAVVGLTGFWLNRPSDKLSYATKAILPWYVLHQTLIIVFAWWLKPFELNIAIESPILLMLTVGGCYVGYELIRRSTVLSFLCGMPVDLKGLFQSKQLQQQSI